MTSAKHRESEGEPDVGALRVVGVIPARWASTRLPGKSLTPIAGKPLIQWVIEAVRQASRLDAVLVATDDARIADVARELGAEAVMTRADHPSGTDRVAEAVSGLEAEVVVNIQGDEPLIDPGLIDRLADALSGDAGEWDMATAALPILNREDLDAPSVVKVVWDARHGALYFSRSVIPCVRDDDMAGAGPLHWRHMGIYAYRAAFLRKLVQTPPSLLERAEKLEQLRALHIGGKMVVLETDDGGVGVDTPEDVAHVEALLRARAGREAFPA